MISYGTTGVDWFPRHLLFEAEVQKRWPCRALPVTAEVPHPVPVLKEEVRTCCLLHLYLEVVGLWFRNHFYCCRKLRLREVEGENCAVCCVPNQYSGFGFS